MIKMGFLRTRAANKNNIHSCNMCGTEINNIWDVEQGFCLIHKFIAFTPNSKYDGKELEAHFCNDCANEIVEIISRECVLNPIKDNGKL